MKKRNFKTRKEAMNNRQSNERLYFDAHKMEYYLVKFRRRNFWGKIPLIELNFYSRLKLAYKVLITKGYSEDYTITELLEDEY